ncbi:MAG: DUF2244 domain-containing protein [Limnobacter sp.]|nr:DUF2244 domain-containing protein [Limnobacter sp.]
MRQGFEVEATQQSDQASQVWVFKRNCSLTPKQLMVWYLSLCAVTLFIALGFLIAGFWIVLPFAGLELLLVGVAFLIYARHAADYEMIEVDPVQLRITVAHGAKKHTIDLVTQWTRLEYRGRFREPLVLKCQDKQVSLGRHIAEKDKTAFQRDLRLALAKSVSPV